MDDNKVKAMLVILALVIIATIVGLVSLYHPAALEKRMADINNAKLRLAYSCGRMQGTINAVDQQPKNPELEEALAAARAAQLESCLDFLGFEEGN